MSNGFSSLLIALAINLKFNNQMKKKQQQQHFQRENSITDHMSFGTRNWKIKTATMFCASETKNKNHTKSEERVAQTKKNATAGWERMIQKKKRRETCILLWIWK